MLVLCPECGLQVSDKANSCPHCGYPMKENIRQRKRSPGRMRLPNGFGQISEIKGKNLRKPFRAMVTVGKTETGRPICKLLKPESYFETYNDAYAALVEYNKNPYDLSPAITVEELYEKWSADYFKTISDGRVITLRSTWKYCYSIYSMRVMDVRARHIKGCMEDSVLNVNGTQKTPTAHVKNNIKIMFDLMLDYAVEYEIVDKNYARTFSLPDDTAKEMREPKKKHIIFSQEEMKVLWENINRKEYADIVIIQCYSGWRPQELMLLKLEDIDLNNWSMKGGMKTKAGKDRVIPIHSSIKELVAARYRRAQELRGEYLFTSVIRGKVKSVSYDYYYKQFSILCDELHLSEGHRPHDCRKHFVSMAKKYKVDEYAIKYMVGHEISDVTERIYTEREFEWLREEMEKIK